MEAQYSNHRPLEIKIKSKMFLRKASECGREAKKQLWTKWT